MKRKAAWVPPVLLFCSLMRCVLRHQAADRQAENEATAQRIVESLPLPRDPLVDEADPLGTVPAQDPTPTELDQACQRGNGVACAKLGTAYLMGDGVTADLPRASQLLEQACTDEEAAGCNNLGALYLTSTIMPHDLPRARAAFEMGCQGHDAASCTHLGLFFLSGWTVAKQDAIAGALFDQGCDGGDDHGCTLRALLAKGGLSVELR